MLIYWYDKNTFTRLIVSCSLARYDTVVAPSHGDFDQAVYVAVVIQTSLNSILSISDLDVSTKNLSILLVVFFIYYYFGKFVSDLNTNILYIVCNIPVHFLLFNMGLYHLKCHTQMNVPAALASRCQRISRRPAQPTQTSGYRSGPRQRIWKKGYGAPSQAWRVW